jgi:hypothetical protein
MIMADATSNLTIGYGPGPPLDVLAVVVRNPDSISHWSVQTYGNGIYTITDRKRQFKIAQLGEKKVILSLTMDPEPLFISHRGENKYVISLVDRERLLFTHRLEDHSPITLEYLNGSDSQNWIFIPVPDDQI